MFKTEVGTEKYLSAEMKNVANRILVTKWRHSKIPREGLIRTPDQRGLGVGPNFQKRYDVTSIIFPKRRYNPISLLICVLNLVRFG